MLIHEYFVQVWARILLVISICVLMVSSSLLVTQYFHTTSYEFSGIFVTSIPTIVIWIINLIINLKIVRDDIKGGGSVVPWVVRKEQSKG